MRGVGSYILSFLGLITVCVANTETIVFKIPYYYNIKPHGLPYSHATDHAIIALNDTHSVINDYPIQTIESLKFSVNNVITIDDYSSINPVEKTLLVKVNNYQDQTFESNDFINIKLCWPAIYPFDFHLDHLYLKPIDLNHDLDGGHKDHEFDIYVEIRYKFHAYTYDPALYLSEHEQLQFQLYVSKLANKLIPIPIELYEFLVYFVDLIIIFLSILPYIYEFIFET